MKLIFAGTPDFAVLPLQKLHSAFGVAAVLTQPDRPQGRKGILTPPPVKQAALALGIPVLQPESLKRDPSVLFQAGGALLVTCAYGQILTQEVLDLYPMGVWNVHASLLPSYRGAAPIPRVIMDGCRETGVTIMKTDIGLDTGDIFLQERCPVYDEDTADALAKRLSSLGAELIVKAVRRILEGDVSLTPQGEGFVCKKVVRTQVDFAKSAREVSCLIRGLSPAPLAFGTCHGHTLNFYFASEDRTESDAPFGTVLSATPKGGLVIKCGEGAVRVAEVQPAGGKRMSVRDFLNGNKLKEGMRFDQPVL
ncbi:MAG TPA: methionyl-tRNA formyltransferase [Candidatus Gallimonas gallistercoris]|uniref:Methionyl-tRNA formyltransferase n=1 Tax=Candidatus Gallimonas gallistercoris TaxID=2838602 RepID=A0A9D2KFD8_9FIRM|nr:methionyl-tRNA formyltransferase [Candidatus Gallimonas gallistercoris]